MSGQSPSCTPNDSSFLFIPCSSARLPPKRLRAELQSSRMPCLWLQGWRGSRSQLSLPNRTLTPGQLWALCLSWPRAPTVCMFLSLSQSHGGMGTHLLAWAGSRSLRDKSVCTLME